MTDKAGEYLKRAEDCQKEADKAASAADKEKWLRRAQSLIWLHKYEQRQEASVPGESDAP